MTKQEIERYLRLLGQELLAEGKEGDVVLAGGAVMLLMIESRDTTKDIDAYFSGDSSAIRAAAERISRKYNLREDWLNDGIKGFFYGTPPQIRWAEYSGLHVYVVDPQYLFAMKAVAGRPSDMEDLKALAKHIGISSAEQGLAIVERYIPERLLTPRITYSLEDVFEHINEEKKRPAAAHNTSVGISKPNRHSVDPRNWPAGYVKTPRHGKMHFIETVGTGVCLCGWKVTAASKAEFITAMDLPTKPDFCEKCLETARTRGRQ